MKFFVALLLGSFAAAATANPYSHELPRDVVKEFLDSGLTYCQKYFSTLDEYHLPDSNGQFSHSGPSFSYNLKLQTKNRKLSGLPQMTYSNLDFDAQNSAQFELNFPQLTMEADFEIMEGSVSGKKVSGKGHSKFEVKNYRMLFNKLHFVEMKYPYQAPSVSLASLQESISHDDVSVAVEGLEVEGMSQEELQKFLHDAYLEYLNSNERGLEFANANNLKFKLGLSLQGKTLESLTEQLKGFNANPNYQYTNSGHLSVEDLFGQFLM